MLKEADIANERNIRNFWIEEIGKQIEVLI